MQGHGAVLQVIHGDTQSEFSNYFIYKELSNGKTVQAEDMPEPQTMRNGTMEAKNVVSMAAARELYEEMIEEIVGGDK